MEPVRFTPSDRAFAELRPWRPQRLLLVTVAAAVIAIALAISLRLFVQQGALARYEYSLVRWEAANLASSAFAVAGLSAEVDEADEAELLAAYFRLTSAIRAELQAETPDAALLTSLTDERARYENDVERIIEGYVADVAAAAGLQRSLPLFGDVRVLWPPVDIELTSPPRLLVRSPRDEIRRAGDTLLHSDLDEAEFERIEAQTDDEDTVSVVVQIGGLAAYPAIIIEDRTYWSILRLTAHEWMHHYLAFYPLGEAWGRGDGTTLNETVAAIAELEIARLVRELHPVELARDADGRAPPREGSPLDRSAELRRLRLEVDALLAEGQVAEAEALMEERRRYLAANGIHIRKINQAYFAFYGSYATRPESSDPIGPKVERVWEETGDLRRFLSLMREVESVDELDALLTRLGVDPATVTVASE